MTANPLSLDDLDDDEAAAQERFEVLLAQTRHHKPYVVSEERREPVRVPRVKPPAFQLVPAGKRARDYRDEPQPMIGTTVMWSGRPLFTSTTEPRPWKPIIPAAKSTYLDEPTVTERIEREPKEPQATPTARREPKVPVPDPVPEMLLAALALHPEGLLLTDLYAAIPSIGTRTIERRTLALFRNTSINRVRQQGTGNKWRYFATRRDAEEP